MACCSLRQVTTSSLTGTSSLVPFNLGGCNLSPPLKTQWRQKSELFWPALAFRASKQSPLTVAPNNRTLVVRAVTTTSEAEAEADVTAEPTDLEELEAPSFDKGKKPTKGLKHLMEILNKNSVEAALKDKELPDIRPGDIIQLRVEVPENKRRVSLLRGIVIAKHNAGINSTFRIRRVFAGVGVEMVFPLYSPNIKEIKVVDSRKVRRAKLFYLRNKIARLSTV